jgi:hypothetical protein
MITNPIRKMTNGGESVRRVPSRSVRSAAGPREAGQRKRPGSARIDRRSSRPALVQYSSNLCVAGH